MNVEIVFPERLAGGRGGRPGGRALQLVAYVVAGQRYAVELAAVECVLPMVAVSPLPSGPDVALGAINLHGRVVAVVDTRRRLRLPAHEYGPAARLLVVSTSRRTLALAADEVLGVEEVPSASVVASDTLLAEVDHVRGLAPLADGLLLVHDVEAFLSLEEERQLTDGLRGAQG